MKLNYLVIPLPLTQHLSFFYSLWWKVFGLVEFMCSSQKNETVIHLCFFGIFIFCSFGSAVLCVPQYINCKNSLKFRFFFHIGYWSPAPRSKWIGECYCCCFCWCCCFCYCSCCCIVIFVFVVVVVVKAHADKFSTVFWGRFFFFVRILLLGLDLQLSRVVFNSYTFCFFNPGRLTLMSLCPLERRNMTIKKTSNQIRSTRCLESKLLHVTNCSPQIHALLSTCITGKLRCKYQWSCSFSLS